MLPNCHRMKMAVIVLQVITFVIVCVTNNIKVTGAVDTAQICSQDYTFYSRQNKCYRFNSDDYKTWYDARKQCQYEGGDLIVIHDQETNHIVEEYMTKNPAPLPGIWLGLREIDLANTFQWTDGSPVDFSKWYPGDPNNDTPYGVDCVVYIFVSGIYGWRDWVCYDLRRYVCEKPAEISLACPIGYESDDEKKMCYKIQYSEKTFQDSRENCQQDGGDLVTISDVQTKKNVINLIEPAEESIAQYWIGLVRSIVDENVFEWLDGNVLDSTEPTAIGTNINENCGTIHRHSLEYFYCDIGCTSVRPSICQKGSPMNDPVFECPRGYKTYIMGSRAMCLMLQFHAPKPWPNATDDCSKIGGELFNFENYDEDLEQFISDNSLSSISYLWGDPDRCRAFLFGSATYAPTICDIEFPYVCQHMGTVNIVINMTESASLIGDICQDASNATKLSRSENGTLYLNRGSLIDGNSLTRFVVQHHKTDCLYKDSQSNCCVNATLNLPINLMNQMEIRIKIPIDKISCLCPEEINETTSPKEQNNQTTLSKEQNSETTSPSTQNKETTSPQEQNTETASPPGQNTGTLSGTGTTSPTKQNTETTSTKELNTETTLQTEQNTGMTSQTEQNTGMTSPTEQNTGMTSPIEQNTEMTSPTGQITEITSQIEQNTGMTSPTGQNTETASPIKQETFDLLRNVTTPKNDSAPVNNLCPCGCNSLKTNFNPSPEDISQMIVNIQKELKVDTNTLSSKRNKKISAKDNRSESRAIGYLGILFCLVPLGLLVALDILRLFQPKNKICAQKINS